MSHHRHYSRQRLTIPETLPTAKTYTYAGNGTSGHNVTYTKPEQTAPTTGGSQLFKMSGGTPSESFTAWCIDIAHVISSSPNAYLLMPLEWVASDYSGAVGIADENLSLADANQLRAILYATLVQYPTREALKTAVNNWITANSIPAGTAVAITGSISDRDYVAGVQSAIWSHVANAVSISGQSQANAIYRFLKQLPGRPESVTASASLSISPITAASYVSEENVDVVVTYTITGTNYDGSAITDATLAGTEGFTVEGGDPEALVADGAAHVLTLKQVPDSTTLNLSISGTYQAGYKAYALTTTTEKLVAGRAQSLLVNELFPFNGTLSAAATSNLASQRGSVVVKKTIANNAADTAGSFSMTLTRTAPYTSASTPITLGSNAQDTVTGLRYGSYTLHEASAPSGYAVVTGTASGSVGASTDTVLEIVNRKLGEITVVKKVRDKKDDPQEFPIVLTLDGETVASGSVSELSSHTFSNLEPGTYTVSEDLSGIDGYTGLVASTTAVIPANGADTTVTLRNLFEKPAVSISKSVLNTESVTPGDTVTYEVTVRNTGNIPLTGMTFADSMFADMPNATSGTIPTTLAVNGTATFQYTYTVASDDYGFLNNRISVRTDEGVSDADDADIFVRLNKDLEVVKTASTSLALPGETVSYTMVITNKGNLPVQDLAYVDALTGTSGSLDITLLPGASTDAITLGDVKASGHVVTNTVEVEGNFLVPNPDYLEGEDTSDEPEFLLEPVTTEDTVVTEVLAPDIEIVKEASLPIALETDTVAYTFTVRNIGDTTLSEVVLSDGALSLTKNIGTLSMNESYTFTTESIPVYALMENDALWEATTRMLTNTAVATGTPVRADSAYEAAEVSDTDSASTRVLKPELVVTKSVAKGNLVDSDMVYSSDPYGKSVDAYAGDWVTYRITVSNNSETASEGELTKEYDFASVTLRDPLLGLDETFDLPANGSKTFWIAYQVKVSDETSTDTIDNTATANNGEPALADTDTARVHVLKPMMTITKTADATSVRAGSLIHYTVTVANTGNVPLLGVRIVDQFAGADPTLLGDFITLEVADSEHSGTWTTTYPYQTASGFTGALVNTATATGYDQMETPVGPVTDEESVRVYIPSRPVVDVTLQVGIEGEGTVNPGKGSYDHPINTTVLFDSIKPADGWVFAGWVGPNGSEIKQDALLLNEDKSVIARFVPETVVITDTSTPLEAPDVTPSPTPTPEMVQPVIPDATDEEIVLDVAVPQDVPVLPKTGGFPLALLFGFGSLLTASGLAVRRGSKK